MIDDQLEESSVIDTAAAILAIPDQVADPLSSPPVTAAPAVTADLASAVQDILPTYWDPAHPSADVFARALAALDAYRASVI